MNRCKTCCMPDTRPDTEFVDGVCSACISYANRPQTNWNARAYEFSQLLDRHDGRCIVPSSGGKDSTAQVIKLLELGADITIVTAATCYLTEIGRKNIENLKRFARTIEVTPNRTVRAKLNRIGLQTVGDITWPEHCAIFNIPAKVAIETGIPLLIYGENPQNQYGGPLGSEAAKTMTRRWVSEFGGFLGLRPTDIIGMEGITARDMSDYMPPSEKDISLIGVEAHFLGQYFEWNSRKNADVAREHGFQLTHPSPACWWGIENLDNAMHGLHDYLMMLKYGYGRGCAQISVDVRTGRIARQHAIAWIKEYDGRFPEKYCGIHFGEILDYIDVSYKEFSSICQKFVNHDLFIPPNHDFFVYGEYVLKEFAHKEKPECLPSA